MDDSNLIRVEGSDRHYSRNKVLVVLLIPLAMALMAISSINVALPAIETGIGASDSDLQWLLSGYALSFGITLVPAGRAGDILGRGTLFVTGVLLFAFASLSCGLATTPLWLNLSRLVQGIGSGLNSPQISGMITQYFVGHRRARAFGLFGLVIAMSVAAGPLTTGLIIQAFGPASGWRFSFLLNFPLGLIAVGLGLWWFPFETERKRRRADRSLPGPRLDLDPVGATLLASVVLCFMLPFMWRRPAAFALLAVGAVLLVLWVAWERRYQARGREPMVDLGLFSHTSFTVGSVISTLQFLGGTSIFAVVAIYLQTGLDVPAVYTGLIGLPNAALSALMAVVASRRALRLGRTLQPVALGLVLLGVLGCIGVSWGIETYGWAFWWLMAPLGVAGVGAGTMGSVNQTLSLIDIPHTVGGTASAIKQTGERIATAIGNAMVTAVFFSLATQGWTFAYQMSYLVIAAVIAAAMMVAAWDRRVHGAGVAGF